MSFFSAAVSFAVRDVVARFQTIPFVAKVGLTDTFSTSKGKSKEMTVKPYSSQSGIKVYILYIYSHPEVHRIYN